MLTPAFLRILIFMQKSSYILSVNVVTRYIILKKSKLLLLWTITLLSLFLLLAFPKDIRNGGSNGAFLCIQVLIPSLFPFMILSDFLVRSGLTLRIPKLFGKISELLFKLPKETFAVFLLSLIGGYPVGARGIKALFEKGHINESEAKRMALFLIGAGPGFLLTFIGSVMLRDIKAGYILLISQTITIILTGILTRFSKDSSLRASTEKNTGRENIDAGCLVESVNSTVKAIAQLSGLVVMFSAICEVYLNLAGGNVLLRPLCAFLEITTGSKILSEGYPLPLISFFTAFGGICVHLQIHSLLTPLRVSKVKFLLFRLLSAFVSMGITSLILKIFPRDTEVFSTIESTTPTLSGSIFGSLMLILFSTLFLISLKTHKKAN